MIKQMFSPPMEIKDQKHLPSFPFRQLVSTKERTGMPPLLSLTIPRGNL